MQPFTNLEIQLIRSSLETKSDGEIAAILERPIEEVHGMINAITNGTADERSEKIQRQKESEHLKISVKELRKRKREEEIAKKEQRQKEKQSRMNAEERRKVEKNRLESRKTFKTKEVDLSKMVSVRIDKKTIVFVNPGTDIEKVKKLYQEKLSKALIADPSF